MTWKRFRRWLHLMWHWDCINHAPINRGYHEIHGEFVTVDVECRCGKRF